MTSAGCDLRWLHISDLHFKTDQTYDQDVVLRAFISSLPMLVERAGAPDLIFVSGDIGTTGGRAEYECATKFFDQLLSACSLTKRELIVVPGNHDVNRRGGRGLTRTIESREDADDYFSPASNLLHITHRQSAFATWFNTYFHGVRTFSDSTTCEEPELLTVRESRVAAIRINSAAFAYDDNDSGKLWIGRRCLEAAVDNVLPLSPMLTVAILHHPLSWLHSLEAQSIKTKLRGIANCILTGHLHETDVEQIAGLTGGALHLAAGAMYQTRKWPNRAMFASLNGRSLTILPIRYEDAPQEVWTVDTSVFPNAPNFQASFDIPGASASSSTPGGSPPSLSAASTAGALSIPPTAEALQLALSDLEHDLFVTPTGEYLYAEPRLMAKPQNPGSHDDSAADPVTIAEIVNSDNSYIIEGRSEYGGTTLCKRLFYEFTRAGHSQVFWKNAKNLPHYRKKLATHFTASPAAGVAKSILILDDFDVGRDDRLLREIVNAEWFSRIIILSMSRGVRPASLVDISSIVIGIKYLYLWNIARFDVRTMASTLFNSSDPSFVSTVVDKVYRDLLALCIPLTPSNVIMYLRILHREGEYHPINRVDIVGRYLLETLRQPSDAYRDNFNSKNKLDLLSSFTYCLYTEGKTEFDDKYWHLFTSRYQDSTLSEFSSTDFLNEAISSRIFVRFGDLLYMKYSFFYSYFLGRYISTRTPLLEKYMNDEEYLRSQDVIDVITGLSSDNTMVVDQLTQKLTALMAEFSEKYVKSDLDPLRSAIWPDNTAADDEMWASISAEIEAGPRSLQEIDKLKTSLISEARTADQSVVLEKFTELESALFMTSRRLMDALRNGDDVAGDLKRSAFGALLKSRQVAFQIGAMFSSIIADRPYFQWGGVAFSNFNTAKGSSDSNSAEAIVGVVTALNISIAQATANEIGTRKLGAVFRSMDKELEEDSFLEFCRFCCILSARAPRWDDTLTKIIERTDRTAYYLASMLDALMDALSIDILPSRDRDIIKRLIAVIQAKRSFHKKAPGARAVGKVLAHLEENDAFSGTSPPPKKGPGD